MNADRLVSATAAPDPAGRWAALAVLASAEVLAMSTWFSATAVIGELRVVWELTPNAASLLTIAVQLGFVVGALLSAVLALPDVFPPRRVMAVAAVGAAAANGALLLVDGAGPAIACRFLTGVFLAGVYPPAMKAMATWFRRGRGLALGVMVGALTLGSALPHLVRAIGGFDWRVVILATSVTTLVGGALAVVGPDGPLAFPRARFHRRQVLDVLRNRRVRLASYGYFGHMWELYAMWAWISAFLAASFSRSGLADAQTSAALGAFGAIGVGAFGCVVGGLLGDRRGRTWAASLSLACSGGAAVLAGLVFGGPVWLVVVLALFWGFWVVADSAQFSALVTEVCDQRYVGTAVTLQLALGFTLTVATIWLVPVLVDLAGWRWAFLVLVPGPILGMLAMRALAVENRRVRGSSPVRP